MNKEELRKSRVRAIRGAIRDDLTPTYIPVYGNCHSWRFLDAGFSITEALFDYKKLFHAVCEFQERYNFDFHTDLGERNPVQVAQALHVGHYLMEDGNLSILDIENMTEDEYDVLVEKGSRRFIFENMAPRIGHYNSVDEAISRFAKAAKEEYEFDKYVGDIYKYFYEYYGVPNLTRYHLCLPGELLFQNYRGIKNFSIDMRRRPEKVLAACDMLFEERGGKEHFMDEITFDGDFAYDAVEWELAHTVCSKKQYEKFFMPYNKVMCDKVVEKDMVMMLFFEDSAMNMVDFLRDYPSGHFVLYTETGDLREYKKLLPNMAQMGGIKSTMLYNGTVEECIDHAKQLIDEVGYDGKYIATTDKILAYERDAKPENLKAVNDFIHEYGVFKQAEA